jgi:hypothetical protein
MEDYTKNDILNILIKMDLKTRKRVLVDQRSYLIGILAYKFMMSNSEIAKETGVTRFKAFYNKKLAVEFCKDKLYIQNVYVYAQLYPFDFTKPNIAKSNRNTTVELVLDSKFYNKLKVTGEILGNKDIRTTIKFLLEKSMKVWEE